MVRPSRLSSRVDGINAAGLIKPKVRGPWSLFQRLSGVRRTPGPGAYNIDTGRFFPGQLFDKTTGGLRNMNRWELFKGGRMHDIALETIGYGGVAIPVVGYWAYNEVYGD